MGGGKRKRSEEEHFSLGPSVSDLPEELVCEIFSHFATSKELVSTVCLVSKRWHRLGKSCIAILDYSVESFSREHLHDSKELPEKLLNFVNNSLEHHTPIPIPIPIRVFKLELTPASASDQRLYTQFEHLLKSLAKLKFSELRLRYVNKKTMPLVLDNSDFLSVLDLTGCILADFGPTPTLFSLQHLHLNLVFIKNSDDFFRNLSQKCPCIVELTLSDCLGFECIDLPPHHYSKLKNLRLLSTLSKGDLGNLTTPFKLKRVRIASESLEKFYLYCEGEDRVDLDIDQCPKLQSLHLHCNIFPCGFHSTNICSTFPNVKKLSV